MNKGFKVLRGIRVCHYKILLKGCGENVVNKVNGLVVRGY